LLDHAAIRQLIDVRSVPRSRRHPHFTREALAESLPQHGIAYRHEPALGGFRRPRRDSPNGGWERDAFRGYADHMDSDAFLQALDDLQSGAHERETCIMCAEAQWWRCHRRLIADALVVLGWRVLHLGLHADPADHDLTAFAVVSSDGRLTYPPLQGELQLDSEAGA
jgi:uncharacterized protein (DUF488 family)